MAQMNNEAGLSERTYQLLKEKIVSLELPPGSALQEKALSQDLQVSRTPLREAISKLIHDKLVDSYPRRGTYVSDISFDDIRNVYSLREVLEPFAASLSTFNIPDEILDKYREAFGTLELTTSIREFQKIDKEFHFMIINYCDNSYLQWLLIDNLYSHITRIRNAYPAKLLHRILDIKQEHFDLLDAFSSRVPEEVEQAMHNHLINALYRMMNVKV